MDFQVEVSGLSLNKRPADTNSGESSYRNTEGFEQQTWISADGQEFWYAESYSFINPPSNSLINKTITVTHETGAYPTEMWLSCGDQSVLMNEDSPGVWSWKLSDTYSKNSGNISNYLNTIADNDPGVVQMTLQPYDNTNKDNCGQGYRSILLSFGPEEYSYGSKNIIYASKLKPAREVIPNLWVGGLAQYIIENKKNYSDDYCLVIDNEISEMGAVSCAVAYYNPVSQCTNTATIDLSGKWIVTGTNRINGYKAYLKYDKWANEAEKHVCTGLLDISTGRSFGDANDPSIDVSGVTFAYPGRRGMSTVQLNYDSTVDWSGDSPDKCYKTIFSNLSETSPKTKKSPNEFKSIKVFDTKIIGGWTDQSDGIETKAAGSYFDRNFIHTNDDSIKIFASNINYQNTTIWQGDTGAAIAPAAYGNVEGSIASSQVKGIFIHRVTHRFNNDMAQNDDMGGLISNRSSFSDKQLYVVNNTATLEGLTISNLYVPSLVNSDGCDVNSISRVIVLSAINPGAGDKQRNCRLNYYQKPSNTTVIQKIQTQNIRLKDIKVSYTTSPDASSGFSTGMICAGDYQFKSLKDGFSGTINYTDANNNEFKLDCYIEKIDY